MSDAPDSNQVSDLRGDIGDSGSPQVFSDAEISRFWYRVRGARTENLQYDATLALMARSLMTNAAKMRDYATGNTSEKQSQIFDHLQAVFNMYKKALDQVLGDNTDIAIGDMSGVTESEQPIDNGILWNHGGYGTWRGNPRDA